MRKDNLLSLTSELRNQASMNLPHMSIEDSTAMFNKEDEACTGAVAKVLPVVNEVIVKCIETVENGGRIICVGTTSVRTLESAANENGDIVAGCNNTEIFIYPGYKFKCMDGIITNFHLPESTLIMLVSAFAGYDETMNAYRHAVEEKYRFFSFGDACFFY